MKKWSVLILTALLITGCQSPAKPNAKSVAEVMEQLSRKADPEQTLVDVDADQIDAFYFFAPDEVLDQQMKMAADTRTDQIAVFEVSHPEEARNVIESSLAAMQQQNANYFPEEADKLEHACILNDGAVFAVVVGEQAEAACSAGLK